jgi:uncharacterized iron-regulated membrane protein
MRQVHRWVSVPAGLFLGLIALTGVYLQTDILLEHYFPVQDSAAQTLPMEEVPSLLKNALARMHNTAPGTRIASIELNARGGVPHIDVIFAGPNGHMQTFDARDGEPSEHTARASQPLRSRLRSIAINLHQGGIIGVSGGWLGWTCGLALLTLVTTGFVVYFRLYRQRVKLRRRAFFWH